MFDVDIFKSEYTQVCSICLVNTITLYYKEEDVTHEKIIDDLTKLGWLDANNIDDIFWQVFRCEFCRNPHLKPKSSFNAAIV